ncbi:MAG: ABC transporter permease [Candidatus Omnitrophica bacterium]|nr:ABC transporter permease [Candidatus Omnitrophota bacterium]MBU1922958.1 ABC transporter permease [Candidatus Omnitrophota bacterium]
MFIHKAIAFIKRDFSIQTSYKLAFILHWLGYFFPLIIFYFIAKLFEKAQAMPLEAYGGRYFPYVLIGIVIVNFFGARAGIFSSSIRREQLTGTLESLLVTPTKISTTVVSLGFWNIISSTIVAFIYLVCGWLFFGVDLSNANIISSIVVFGLTIICSVSLGIISASFTMVYKMGDPVSYLFGNVMGILGGVFFPVTMLPKGLRFISHFLPITFSLKALRLSLLKGYSVGQLTTEIIALLLFSIFLLPLSILIFKYSVREAKKSGSLIHY